MTTPTPEGTSPENGILPDTPVEAVTLERIGEIFTSENLEYRIVQQPVSEEESVEILRTGFTNTAIAMQVRENTLILDSVWRGSVPTSEGPKILALANQWNTENFAPTLRFFESTENELAVSAVREINVTHGLSRNQIGAFVMASLDSVLQAWQYIESNYPQLVTWEAHEND